MHTTFFFRDLINAINKRFTRVVSIDKWDQINN